MRLNSSHRLVTNALVILIRSCIGLIWASAGPLIPLLMNQYGISRGTAGWFASAAPITIAILALPVGIVLSRFSLKKALAVGAFLQAAGLLALTPFFTSYVSILVLRVVFALGIAVTVPVATSIAAEWFSTRELPLVNGITMSLVNVANVAAFVATVPIAGLLSWNAPIAIYGGVALTCAVAWVLFGKDRHQSATTKKDSLNAQTKSEAPVNFGQVLTQKSTILMALAVMGSWALGNAMGSWLPNYYHEVFGMPLAKASSITAVIMATGTLACIVGGLLPLRFGRRRPFLIIPSIFAGLSAVAAVLFNNPVVIFIAVGCFGLAGNLAIPTLFTVPMELPNATPRTGGIIISSMQSGGNIGCFFGPLIVGYLADMTGSYLPGFFICAALSLSMVVAGILLPETGSAARAAKRKSSGLA